MVVEVSGSGEVGLYRGHGQLDPFTRVDRPAWECAVAVTYTNDSLCPVCAKGRGTGHLVKDMSYIYQGKSDGRQLLGTQVRCSRCHMAVVRFRFQNKNYFFSRPTPAPEGVPV